MGKNNPSKSAKQKGKRKPKVQSWSRAKKHPGDDDLTLVRQSPRLIIKSRIQNLTLSTQSSFESLSKGESLKAACAKSDQNSMEQEQQPQAQDSVLQLPPEMLLKIFKMLQTRDLLAVRKVSRACYSLATSLYRDRADNVTLFFEYDIVAEGYHLGTLKYRNSAMVLNRRLTDFTRTLRRSISLGNSPFTRFHFQIPVRGSQDMLDFLELWRAQIKYLSLETTSFGDQVEDDANTILLLHILPNVQCLSLSKFISPYYANEDPQTQTETSTISSSARANFDPFIKRGLQLHSIKFPSLKSLYVAEILRYNHFLGRMVAIPVVKDILGKATNLTHFRAWLDMRIDILTTLLSMGKAHTIKTAIIDFSRENLQKMDSVTSEKNLKLSFLTLDMYKIFEVKDFTLWNQAGAIVNNLLEKQAGSLKSLKIIGSIGFLPGIKIPTMNNLRNLQVSSSYPNFPCLIFPPQVDLSTLFPKLTSVDFDVGETDRRNGTDLPLTTFFPPQMELTNVAILNLKNPTAETHFEELSKLFPRIKYLSFGFRIRNFPENGPNIWKIRSVEFLDLEIGSLPGQNLDCVFTGYSFKYLKQFYNMSNENILKKISNNPPIRNQSIRHLTELATLRINLHVTKDNPPTFSKLSWFFAFRLMQNLKRIEIVLEKNFGGRKIQDFDLVNGLESLKPFVTKISST